MHGEATTQRRAFHHRQVSAIPPQSKPGFGDEDSSSLGEEFASDDSPVSAVRSRRGDCSPPGCARGPKHGSVERPELP